MARGLADGLLRFCNGAWRDDDGDPVEIAEVVRCKDCKHWKPGDSFGGDSLDDMQRIGRCPIMRFGRREKDFCCDGERKDND